MVGIRENRTRRSQLLLLSNNAMIALALGANTVTVGHVI